MLSRILLMCCLSFHLNGLLGEHLEQATYGNTTVTWLELDELDLENPIEGIFVFNDDQRNYYEQLAECKSRFPHTGVEVTLLKNMDYLLAASQLQSINFGSGHRIDLHFEIVQQVKYTYEGYWHWIDGSSNFTADDEMWANKHPMSSNTWPNNRKVQCAAWSPSEDGSLIGTISSTRCYNAMYHAICQISDTDECAAAVSPCHDPAGCINTVGGFQCTFLGDAIDVYTTVADYYREVFNCGGTYPTDQTGCSPHSRADNSSACYDEGYDTCTQAAYGDMTHILGDIYDVMVDCYGLPCPLGTADCDAHEVYECPGNEYVELFADLDKCGHECNLISECGGGGFDCLANEDVCKTCFEELKLEEV